jgi:hypothetical protein
VPATELGISVSTLSVLISAIAWSTSMWSPGSTSHSTIVPLSTDSPSWGSVTCVVICAGLVVSGEGPGVAAPCRAAPTVA